MLRRVLALSALALAAWSGLASPQAFSARRMAMGGVILAGGGPGSDANNVAYRAVPRAPGSGSGITLPLGVLQLLADPPQLDPDKPDFNIYELANLAYNPPWNLQLVSASTPANDITIAVGRNRLAVDLGDVKTIFPKDHSKLGSVVNGPALGFGFRRFFLAAAPLVHYQNDLSFNDALLGALGGDEFRTRTEYAMTDQGRAQAAAGVHLGWAGPLMTVGDPRGKGTGLYAGARVKLMRGLAYAEGDSRVSFTTEDTLFAIDPVDVGYAGHYYDAGPDGGGLGRGLDLGAAWLGGGLEFGLGVNDIGTTFDWRVRESVARRDSATGDYVQDVVATDRALKSTVPVTVTANAAAHLGRVTLAADVVRGVNSTTSHAGAEVWFSSLALRAGAYLDPNELLQYTAGAGVRFGHLGFDLALATNSRNLSRERGLELGAGLALYH
jgi:hypothetical protein